MTKPTPHGQVPEALRQAAWLKKEGASCQRHYDLGVLIERQHTELETLREKLKTYEDLDEAGSDVQLLRAGYAAARLEIESLQARIKTMAEEHADELTVAHLDGRMRVAQLAGAQQPDTATWALPDADSDYMRKVVAVAVTMLFDGYKEDVTRVFSPGELSEFVTITAAMGGERVEDIYRRAWDLLSLPARASHGQAPAQAAPGYPITRFNPATGSTETALQMAAVIALRDEQAAPKTEALEQAARLALETLERASDSGFSVECDESIAALRKALEQVTSEAPQQEATDALARAEYYIDNPSAWSNFDQRASDAIAAVCKAFRAAHAPADSVLEDAARLEALHAAVTAIYLDDSSDFKSALGAVVRHLDPKLAGDLLAWPKRAYDISQARLDAARKQGANHD